VLTIVDLRASSPPVWKTENWRFGIPQKFSQAQSTWASIVVRASIELHNHSSASQSLILRNTTHTGPIRGLDFNPIQTTLFASGGVAGEVCLPSLSICRQAEIVRLMPDLAVDIISSSVVSYLFLYVQLESTNYLTNNVCRFTSGTSRTQANLTRQRQVHGAPSSMKLRPLHGISRSNTSLPAPAAPGTPSCGT
jgi:hypothetical protein